MTEMKTNVTPEGAKHEEGGILQKEGAKQEEVSELDEEYPKQTGLKILVVVLGLGIIIMLGLIIYKIVDLLSGKDAANSDTAPAPVAIQAVPARATDVSGPDLNIKKPDNSILHAIIPRDQRQIILHFKGQGGELGETIILLNVHTGETQTITVQ